ncbi:ATP-binding cassette domain-containing protein, partial [Prevotella disiens]
MEIKIENLKKIYGENTVIDIPEFTISDGQLIGLVGNNGAGKTTLMRLMLDLIKANEGRVLSNGNAVNEDFAWKQYTGSFVDKSFLIDFYTPEEFFQFIADAYDIDSETLEERLQEFMPLMRDEILGTGKLIREFSEGNRQKIGIIGAMIVRPELLILDEPFNYLDPSSQINIAKIIHQVNQKYGTTVLISSHNL